MSLTNRTAIIILGMHRSGTSSLAGSLQQKGLYLGKVIEKSVYNPKGNRESPKIIELNDDLLQNNGGSWDNPPSKLNWDKYHELRRDEIIASISNTQSGFFGFKDPRTLLTVDFWNGAFEKSIYIASIRNPMSVALSLNSRNHIPIEKAFALWYHYNNILLRLAQSKPVMMLNFDSSREEYLTNLALIAQNVGFSDNENTDELEFYDNNLINHKHEELYGTISIPENITETYSMLLALYQFQMKHSYRRLII